MGGPHPPLCRPPPHTPSQALSALTDARGPTDVTCPPRRGPLLSPWTLPCSPKVLASPEVWWSEPRRQPHPPLSLAEGETEAWGRQGLGWGPHGALSEGRDGPPTPPHPCWALRSGGSLFLDCGQHPTRPSTLQDKAPLAAEGTDTELLLGCCRAQSPGWQQDVGRPPLTRCSLPCLQDGATTVSPLSGKILCPSRVLSWPGLVRFKHRC